MDLDELECLLANLVAKKMIRGFVAHGRMLVVAKDHVFPAPASLFKQSA